MAKEARIPVVSSRNMGQLLRNIKKADPLFFSRIGGARIGYRKVSLAEDVIDNICLSAGDIVLFASKKGETFPAIFFSDR